MINARRRAASELIMKPLRKLALIFLVSSALLSAAPVTGQEYTFTPSDNFTLQTCLQSINGNLISTSPGKAKAARDCIGLVSQACQMEKPENQTTFGMIECNRREIDWWDNQLNLDYARLRQELPTVLFTQLQQVQRDWLTYRDGACNFEYSFWEDGSIRHIFFMSCKLQTTAERSLDLKRMLDWMDL